MRSRPPNGINGQRLKNANCKQAKQIFDIEILYICSRYTIVKDFYLYNTIPKSYHINYLIQNEIACILNEMLCRRFYK